MTLGPTIAERLARARADLRMGVPVVLTGRRARPRWSSRSKRCRPTGWPTCAALGSRNWRITAGGPKR